LQSRLQAVKVACLYTESCIESHVTAVDDIGELRAEALVDCLLENIDERRPLLNLMEDSY